MLGDPFGVCLAKKQKTYKVVFGFIFIKRKKQVFNFQNFEKWNWNISNPGRWALL